MSGDIIHNVSDSWKSRAEAAETAHRQLEVQYLQDTTELTRRVSEQVRRAEAAEAEAAKWRELHDDRDRDLAFEFARANAAETEVAQLRTALDLIDAARAKAVNEIETMHRYLDECFAFAPDEGRAVPLVDRIVRLVSMLAANSTKA